MLCYYFSSLLINLTAILLQYTTTLLGLFQELGMYTFIIENHTQTSILDYMLQTCKITFNQVLDSSQSQALT